VLFPILLNDGGRQHRYSFDKDVLEGTVIHKLHDLAGGDPEAAAGLGHPDDLSGHRSYLQESPAYRGGLHKPGGVCSSDPIA